jgi:adenylate cyclase
MLSGRPDSAPPGAAIRAIGWASFLDSTQMNVDKAAAAVGEGPETLRDWVTQGVVPEYTGEWTRAAVGKARLVKRILERGYTLEQVREATEQGRLISGQIVELFGVGDETYSRVQVAKELGLDPSVVDRVTAMLGVGAEDELGEPDRDLLRYIAKALDVGLPLDAMLQLTRVYVRAISQVADAEVRLVHLYVHEPLMRSGASAEALGQELLTLTEELMPLAGPLLEQLHWRMLSHFIEQDVVGHMETEVAQDADDVGLMLVAIAFADLAGYTQLTEREGDLHALDVVNRFLHEVDTTLPDHARVIKTIGDEVMIVGPDPEALTGWAVALRARLADEPRPRIAVHYGYARYRDGDYYGREVNLAARVSAESGAGEVLVTRAVVEASGSQLRFEPIADVQLRGFTDSTEIFRASAEAEAGG